MGEDFESGFWVSVSGLLACVAMGDCPYSPRKVGFGRETAPTRSGRERSSRNVVFSGQGSTFHFSSLLVYSLSGTASGTTCFVIRGEIVPDNEQARTDEMTDKHVPHHKRISTFVILALFFGIIALIVWT